MPTMSPRDGARPPPDRARADRPTWTIEVSGVRADTPRLRTRKAYVLTDVRYHDAADCARRLAHMAGLVDVLIVGVTLSGAPGTRGTRKN